MMKKSLKKKMVMALAGIILAGSMGWSQIPAQAAVNGETICSHSKTWTEWTDEGYQRDYWGHMKEKFGVVWCKDICQKIIGDAYVCGDYEKHDYTKWDMIEDRGDGLYRFLIWCDKCGYKDETLSDDPEDVICCEL